MGTLFEQQPRQNAVKYFSPKGNIDWCRWIDKQAIDLGWEVSDVLKAFEIQELEKAKCTYITRWRCQRRTIIRFWRNTSKFS